MKKPVHQIATLAIGIASAAHSPAKLALAVCFSLLALAFGTQEMRAATVTYIVGTCKSGTQFSTIQSALDASPAPDTVEVCPGKYYEQIAINHPVTLEGIAAGNGALAEIILPDSYAVNATLIDIGVPATAQIFVHNVSGGDVNLTNLKVSGEGFGLSGTYFVGILYQQSSGTINQVVTIGQNNYSASNVTGFGIYIEAVSSTQSVTVENSAINDFSQSGIFAIGATTTPDLTVTIKNNGLSTVLGPATESATYDIVVEEGTDPTVTGNIVSGGTFGIYSDTPTGSIAGNTVVGAEVGITLGPDGPSVTSNNIYGAIQDGIFVSSELKASVVTNNTIRSVNSPGSFDSTGTGVYLNCNNVSSSNVHSNTLMDSLYGFGSAPAGFGGSNNTYSGVATEVETCTSNSPNKVGAASPLKLLGQLRGQ
jgi:hypothetical protein